MTEDLAHSEVLFVAGVGPMTQNTADRDSFCPSPMPFWLIP